MDVNEPRAKKLSHSLHGLQQALVRHEGAHWHQPEDAFTAAAEAVWWVVSLDRALENSDQAERDRRAYKDARGASANGQTVIGMKFVRNHVDHLPELHDFVELSSVVGNSWQGMRAGWIWKPLDELEPLLDPKFKTGHGASGMKQYRDRLGGKLVEHTLLDANQWFLRLQPPIPALPSDESGAELVAFALGERWPPVEGDRRV